MNEIGRWLIRDEQSDLFDLLVALILNSLFLLLIALLLWPLGQLTLAFGLAKGYGILWIVTVASAILLNWMQRLLRVNMYDRGEAYVISNLFVSCVIQVGWSAFTVLTLHSAMAGVSVWVGIILYGVAVASCFIAFVIISSFYKGSIYRIVCLLLALVSFVVFSVWPASGRGLYGWFLQLF